MKNEYLNIKKRKLKLDMSRGKPSSDQLYLSEKILNCIDDKILNDYREKSGIDIRNYGCLEGLPEARSIMAGFIGCEPNDVIIGGNSSLSMMHDVLTHFFVKGVNGCKPWSNKMVKFLCPSPGYDRHFKLCEYFGIDMIQIKMLKNGPDMNQVIDLSENDEKIKGIWCVPKFSNPQGIVYSEETVDKFSRLKPAAKDFRIFWDNAYSVHELGNKKIEIPNIFKKCRETNNENLVIAFCSTSKITFAGGGISAIGCRKSNFKEIKDYYSFKTIGFDKINQLRHIVFLENKVSNHMNKHSFILKPKFDLIINSFKKNFEENPIIEWTEPQGGYFISVQTFGSARRIVDLCAEAGLIITPAGAAFPYGDDHEDSNIRIAPSNPNIEELKAAVEIFCLCSKISAAEKILESVFRRSNSNTI
jgi:DNA-binding transcriptional MocR family regulator